MDQNKQVDNKDKENNLFTLSDPSTKPAVEVKCVVVGHDQTIAFFQQTLDLRIGAGGPNLEQVTV